VADPRPVTLLQLAVGASAAVVPVLLGVLLVVANAREADDAKPARGTERHVSVREVAALRTFEYAVVRRDRVHASLPAAETLLERLPQCRAEWSGTPGLLMRARMAITHANASGQSRAARIAGDLATIDHALLRFSSTDNRRVTDPVGLDGARWIEAVATALATPATAPDYPGRVFRVQCADVATAVATLARSNARMLDSLAWRGTEVDRVIARWRPDQYVEIAPRNVARANPWEGIPGCIYLASNGPVQYLGNVRGLDDRLCTRREMLGDLRAGGEAVRVAGEPSADMPFGDPRWSVPPSLATLLQPLEALHRPVGAMYRQTGGANRIALGRNPVDVGYSIDLAIDPAVQALAQQTAACYTGRDDICRALDMRRKEDGASPLGHALLEHAMVRVAAIAIVDVATGRIEALAGAMSPCAREEYDGPGRSARCDRRLPYPVRYRPDALQNPAVFVDAMPASTIKPIMAAAFLSDPHVGARWLAIERAEMARAGNGVPSAQSLRGQLMRSDSGRFLDRMFCADKDFTACARPWAIQAQALAFGWNGGCAQPREDCGKRDVLFGQPAGTSDDARTLAFEVPYGRLLAEPLDGKLASPFRLRPAIALDTARVRRCAAGPDGRRFSKDDWEKCSGGVVVDVVAEGWGQGHARASALGGAGMMQMLAAAANGETEVRPPHLVEALRGASMLDASGMPEPARRVTFGAPEPDRIASDAAQVILSGLAYGHRAGTSRSACEQVFDARTCQQIDWIAGKTGTPTFPNDDRTLDELAKLCRPGVARTKKEDLACGPLRPYKWYVAAYRADPSDPRWTKVIGVLTERNWIAATGRVHGAGDHGPNPAAEIAMQIAGRQAGLVPRSAH
jgi:hypothetical protein